MGKCAAVLSILEMRQDSDVFVPLIKWLAVAEVQLNISLLSSKECYNRFYLEHKCDISVYMSYN